MRKKKTRVCLELAEMNSLQSPAGAAAPRGGGEEGGWADLRGSPRHGVGRYDAARERRVVRLVAGG